jgi:predicted GNAT family acetyltransferase
MTIIDNKEGKRFEHHLDGDIAFINYILAKGKIFLTHTEVPKDLEGKGIASGLVKSVLQEVKDRDLILVPMCPFVAAYIKRHPEGKELVLKGIKIK